ncbi:MAG: zf-HC2 domain-containing protein [Spirochaetota bacterium]|nr:MAG: zf-HC2 domain-containing protein [Spirochaetota bacterium]
MKRCPFNNPDFITSYYDGCLPEEEKERFEEHLFTCKMCMDALYNLENDLFLMRSMKYKHPAEHKFQKALFRLISDGIELIKNVEGPFVFEPLVPVRVRGKAGAHCYKLQKDRIIIEVGSKSSEFFDVEVSGIEGRQVYLYSKDKLVEARSCVREKHVTLNNLNRGSYKLSVDDEDLVEFIVK